jgi:hypothetical protein
MITLLHALGFMLGSTPQGYLVQGKGKVGNDHGDMACAIITTTKEAAQKAKGGKGQSWDNYY